VLRTAPKQKLTQAIAYITWPALSAFVIGPPLGGFITTYANWHWIFFLNLPIGIAAVILAMLWIENERTEKVHPFDWLTFLLGGFASAGVLYAMEEIGGDGVHQQLPTVILALSVISGIVAVAVARRHPARSLIDFESLKLRTFALSIYGGSTFRIAVNVLPFLLPLMFQIAFGLTAFQSGLYLLALFAGDLSMKAFTIPALLRFGFRRVLIVNGVVTALSIAVCSTLAPSTPVVLIIIILFLHGAFRSMEFTCITTLAYSEIAPSRMSCANSFLSAVMQLSSGMGVAIGAITLRHWRWVLFLIAYVFRKTPEVRPVVICTPNLKPPVRTGPAPAGAERIPCKNERLQECSDRECAKLWAGHAERASWVWSATGRKPLCQWRNASSRVPLST
jgi:predicted MFS family arabinose efflux permease